MLSQVNLHKHNSNDNYYYVNLISVLSVNDMYLLASVAALPVSSSC